MTSWSLSISTTTKMSFNAFCCYLLDNNLLFWCHQRTNGNLFLKRFTSSHVTESHVQVGLTFCCWLIQNALLIHIISVVRISLSLLLISHFLFKLPTQDFCNLANKVCGFLSGHEFQFQVSGIWYISVHLCIFTEDIICHGVVYSQVPSCNSTHFSLSEQCGRSDSCRSSWPWYSGSHGRDKLKARTKVNTSCLVTLVPLRREGVARTLLAQKNVTGTLRGKGSEWNVLHGH